MKVQSIVAPLSVCNLEARVGMLVQLVAQDCDAQGLEVVEVLRQARHGELVRGVPLVVRVWRAALHAWVRVVALPRGLVRERGLLPEQVVALHRELVRERGLLPEQAVALPREQVLQESLVRFEQVLLERIGFHAKVADHQTRIQIPSGPNGIQVVTYKLLHRLKAFCTDPLDYLG